MAARKTHIAPLASAVGLTLVAVAAIGFAAYERAGDQLMERARETNLALMQLRRDALRQQMERTSRDAQYWAGDRTVREILGDLGAAWAHQGSNAGPQLRRAYLSDNPHPVGERHLLDTARDGSDYSTLHAAHHPWMRRFLDQYGYHDVFLMSPEGDLLYTAFKEDDFGTNLLGGPYRESGLGEVFRAAKERAEPGTVVFSDFAPYLPSHGAPAAFVASPVLSEDGALLGVLAFQMPIEPINEIMHAQQGLGKSGESYAVGPDHLMRSDSRFSDGSTLLRTRVDTQPVRLALAGQSGVMLSQDHRGEAVLSAYGPLEFLGTTWAVMADMDEYEVLEPIRRLRNFLVVSTIIAMVVVSSIVGIALSLLLNRPDPQPVARPRTSVG